MANFNDLADFPALKDSFEARKQHIKNRNNLMWPGAILCGGVIFSLYYWQGIFFLISLGLAAYAVHRQEEYHEYFMEESDLEMEMQFDHHRDELEKRGYYLNDFMIRH